MSKLQKLKRKAANARQASQTIQRRTLVFAAFFGVAAFVLLFIQLYRLQITDHEALQERAAKQQTLSTTITASRGTIYDRTGETLAVSAAAETIFISPRDIAERSKQENEKEGDRATYLKGRYEDYVAEGLARILGLEKDWILTRMEKTNSQYEWLVKKADQETADEVRRFINGEIDEKGNIIVPKDAQGRPLAAEDWQKNRITLRGIYLSADSKRFYPYSTLASHVIGFVNGENQGAYGTEALYEEELQGAAGLTVTAKDVNGKTLLYQYEQYYDAQNGDDVVLTIDANIQYYLEKGMEEMVAKYKAKNGATGIVMDVNTGALLGLASLPNYDLNNYSDLYDAALQQQWEEAKTNPDEEARSAKLKALRDRQWRNKCLNDTYEPGSTYKILTLSMALEEGVVNKNSSFHCSGSVRVKGVTKPINCSNHAGHGTQDLATATANSCNPAFISMGYKIGSDTYYNYLEDFGLFEPTGVDLPGEASGLFTDRKTFNSAEVYVACYSFGQTFTVTPLQLITAQAACINGGYLHTPYVVEQVKDQNGNIISQHDSTPVRQVISEETSATVREILENVVANGTGRNGQVAGYRIGGKTGSSETTEEGRTIVSFMGFAPAENPQVIVLIAYDKPQESAANPKVGTCGTFISGGNMAAPKAGPLIAKILDYMGVEKEYTAEESAAVDVSTPRLTGKSLADAQSALSKSNLGFRTIGSGDTVTSQIPAAGAPVPGGSTVILYLGDAVPQEKGVVPDVTGLNYEAARNRLESAGFFMRASGVSTYYGNTTTAESQSVSGGEEAAIGTVVNVGFFNVMEDGSVGVW